MVWLNHNGPVQPFGSEVASNVSLGGHTYNIWEGTQSVWDTVTYDMTSPATSNLDVGTLAQDSVSRGYTKNSWYLIDVEAGFELWQGGAGLETNSFSVNVNGNGTCLPPRRADPHPDVHPPPTETDRPRRVPARARTPSSAAGRAASRRRSWSRTPGRAH